MNEFKPNSHKYRDEQKTAEERKIEKVVSGTVTTKKKSGVSKFTDVFISEDANNVKSYIVSDVLIPALKKLFSDIVKDGIDMILYGSANRSRSSNGVKVSYRSYSDDRKSYDAPAVRNRLDFDEIVYPDKGTAERVLQEMEYVLDRYRVVTVADMYDMSGLVQPHTSNRYGWTSLRTAETMRVKEGYVIKLPRAVPID